MHLSDQEFVTPAAQLLQRADGIKEIILKSSHEVLWEHRLELQQLYEQILLLDLDYAIARLVEQAMWNVCYKHCFDVLEKKCRANPKIDDGDVALHGTFLSSAYGHLMQLLTKLSAAYNAFVPGFQAAQGLGILNNHWDVSKVAKPDNLVYIFQFILIHIGDIIRYQKQNEHSVSYYIHAVNVAPYTGHVYNQLAIVEGAMNNRLAAVYFYTRALCVRQPFSLAATNLEKLYGLLLSADNLPNLKDVRISPKTYGTQFLRLQVAIHQCSHLDTFAAPLSELLRSQFLHCLENGLDCWETFHMFVICMGAMWKLVPDSTAQPLIEEAKPVDVHNLLKELSPDEQCCLDILFQIFMGHLSTLAQYLTKVSGGHETVRLYLPSVKIACDWLKTHFALVKALSALPNSNANVFQVLLGSLCNLFNSLALSDVKRPKGVKPEHCLPEDYELREFLPLVAAHTALDFLVGPSTQLDAKQIQKVRIFRLLSFGQWLAATLNEPTLFTCDLSGGKPTFSAQMSISSRLTPKHDLLSPVSSGHSSPSESSTLKSRRPSKLVAMRTILEGKNNEAAAQHSPVANLAAPVAVTVAESDGVKLTEPRFKIALPGSAVQVALASEKVRDPSMLSVKFEEPERPSSHESAEGSGGNKRYELPPRFQASKLKLALGGKSDPTSVLRKPDSSLSNAAFPPLNSTFANSGTPGPSNLSSFTQAHDFEMFGGVLGASAESSHLLGLDGEDLKEPVGHERKADFPRTPGARPTTTSSFPVFNFPGSSTLPERTDMNVKSSNSSNALSESTRPNHAPLYPGEFNRKEIPRFPVWEGSWQNTKPSNLPAMSQARPPFPPFPPFPPQDPYRLPIRPPPHFPPFPGFPPPGIPPPGMPPAGRLPAFPGGQQRAADDPLGTGYSLFNFQWPGPEGGSREPTSSSGAPYQRWSSDDGNK